MSNAIFKSVPAPRLKRSNFNLSFENKLSFDFGMIVPIFAKDMLPGDNFYYAPEVFLRCAPLVAPMMQLCDVHVDVFKCPMRVLWKTTPEGDGFENFISPADVFGEGVQPVMPQIELQFGTNVTTQSEIVREGSLMDYLGLPVLDSNISPNAEGHKMKFRSLDFRAYQWICDEFYRQEDLQEKVLNDNDDFAGGIVDDETTIAKLMALRYRNWSKDYFTSALPNTQRGIDIGIPITADIDIYYDTDKAAELTNGTLVMPSAAAPGAVAQAEILTTTTNQSAGHRYLGTDAHSAVNIDNTQVLSANMENVVATINDLRLSIALQRWAEASMRGGARYPEILLSTFGVRPRDARLDRPECMGRVSFPLQISEVLQTSQTTSGDDASPQGNMSGRGVAYGKGRYIHVYAEEHCIMMALLSVMPRASYQQGMPKRWTKFDKFDYYWPQFDALGEQAIKNRELFYDFSNDSDDESTNDATFGYQQRWCEYKNFPNEVHGEFRVLGLNSWHMGRIFSSAPALNADFLSYESEKDAINQRVFASGASTSQHLWCQVMNNLRAKRPMSYQVVPHIKG